MIDCIVVLGASITALAVARTATRMGMRVIIASTRKGIAMRSKYGEKFVFSHPEVDEIIDGLRMLLRGEVACCMADSDDWLKFIAANRREFEALFAKVLHPSQEVLATCLDKNRFLSWCWRKGFSAPKQYQVNPDGEITPMAKFPLLVRPERTLHGDTKGLPKALEVRNGSELKQCIHRFRDLSVRPAVCESLLRPGIRQYSVGFARRLDGKSWMTVAEKLRSLPDQCAGGTYVVGSVNPHAEDLVHRVTDALDYFGVGEAEVLHDTRSGKCYIIEINARPWAQYALAERMRPGMLKFLLNMNDIPIRGMGKTNPNARWLNFTSDLFICFSRSCGIVRSGRVSTRSYLASIARANAFALFDYRDPGPFLHDTRRLAHLIRDGIRSSMERP